MTKVFVKKSRPKKKEDLLRERKKNPLDEMEEPELFLDEGAETPDESDDEAPEEQTFRKATTDDESGRPKEEKSRKKKKKRRVKKLDDGVYEVNVESASFKVVSLDAPQSSRIMLKTNFKEELLALSTKKQRRTNLVNTAHQEKWISKRH